jgi:hypothetical protein
MPLSLQVLPAPSTTHPEAVLEPAAHLLPYAAGPSSASNAVLHTGLAAWPTSAATRPRAAWAVLMPGTTQVPTAPLVSHQDMAPPKRMPSFPGSSSPPPVMHCLGTSLLALPSKDFFGSSTRVAYPAQQLLRRLGHQRCPGVPFRVQPVSYVYEC